MSEEQENDSFAFVTRAKRFTQAAAVVLGVMLSAILVFGEKRPEPRDPAAEQAAHLRELRALYTRPAIEWPKPRLLDGAIFTELGALAIRPRPTGTEAALAQLGEKLFKDPILSASGHFACESCHNRRLGWGDGVPLSFGHGRATGRRNAPSLFSAGYLSSFFWDGRAGSLEEQAIGPMSNPVELANTNLDGLVQRVRAVEAYREAFLATRDTASPTLDDIAAALAAFQRTIERRTRFDRFARGDSSSLTDEEVWGLHLFRTKAGCVNCHNGPLLSDQRLHNIGLSFFGRRLEDLGRYDLTGKDIDAGRFKTPSLRHVSQTTPYMHNGIFTRLTGIVRFYEGGGGRVRDERKDLNRLGVFNAAREISPLVKRFKLTPAERRALVAFLNAL